MHLLKEDTSADLGSIDIFRKATTEDTVSGLMKAVADGWSESRKDCHPLLVDYWIYRDEISAENALLFKGHGLIITHKP